ncbi:hypothetical protein [Paenibacillus polymyxa]|uniref:hypothetical protein n=1 Tax=Paenibacillus polymyxa TaxID=1406 RepID=UPI0025B6A47D|nr:hypothetical protein [Paenibacillus polymyxa]MDN4089600.1 hypothetical protein [Paenibacillus polymyxa]
MAGIAFLEKRVDAIKEDIQAGKGKSFRQEMLEEMQTKLTEKKGEYGALSVGLHEVDVPEEFTVLVKYTDRTVGCRDSEFADVAFVD